MKDGLHDQGSALSIGCIHLSVLRNRLVVSGYTYCLKNCVEKRILIRNETSLQNRVQRLSARENYILSGRRRKRFVLIRNYGEEEPLL